MRILPVLGLLIILAIGEVIFAPKQVLEAKYEPYRGDLYLIEQNSYKAIVPPCELRFRTLTALTSAYNPVPAQTDSTPDIMASGNKVYEGAVACPRDIPFGTIVEIDEYIYICEDRTHLRYDGIFDILMFSREEALNWGKQIKEIKLYY